MHPEHLCCVNPFWLSGAVPAARGVAGAEFSLAWVPVLPGHIAGCGVCHCFGKTK